MIVPNKDDKTDSDEAEEQERTMIRSIMVEEAVASDGRGCGRKFNVMELCMIKDFKSVAVPLISGG